MQRPCKGGGGGSHVAHLNFKRSRVCVYKCLSFIVSFAITVAIWPKEVVSHSFILCADATFWAMSLVGIYPDRASCTEIPPLSYSFNSQTSWEVDETDEDWSVIPSSSRGQYYYFYFTSQLIHDSWYTFVTMSNASKQMKFVLSGISAALWVPRWNINSQNLWQPIRIEKDWLLC